MSTNIITDFQINNNLTITDNNLKIQTDGTTNTLDISGNVDVSSNLIIRGYIGIKTETPVVSIDISANDALRIPVGNSSSRPDYTTIDCSGCIRYNSETTQFEGFSPSGLSWIGLGGVVDIDQDTKILAELNSDEDKLRFYTAGGQQMLIDEYGNVGIGLASANDPAYILDINSTGAIRIPIGTTSERNEITNTAGLIRYNSSNNEFEGYSTAWGGLGGVKTPTGNTKITADDTNGLEFFTSNDEKMTILANGNVGIGTDSPRFPLEIRSAPNTTTSYRGTVLGIQPATAIDGDIGIRINASVSTADNSTYIEFVPMNTNSGHGKTCFIGAVGDSSTTYSSDIVFKFRTAPNYNYRFDDSIERMRITHGGNVGIGTDSPDYKLDVRGSGDQVINVYSTGGTNSAYARFSADDGATTSPMLYVAAAATECQFNSRWDHPMVFYQNNSEVMRIHDNGNVGIGTDSPETNLQVQGGFHVKETSDDWSVMNSCGKGLFFRFYGNPHNRGYIQCIDRSNSDTQYNLQYNALSHDFKTRTNNTDYTRMIIQENGNVGIDTPSPKAKLQVNGSVIINTYSANQGGTAGIFFRESNSPGGSYPNDIYNCSIMNYDHLGTTSADGISINGYDGVSICTGSNSRSERFRVDIDGNVGIGTDSPTKKLDIRSSYEQVSVLYETDGINFSTINASNTIWSLGYIGGYVAAGASNSTGSYPGGLVFKTKNPGSWTSSSSIDLVDRMVIDTNGNVGIGNTAPVEKLHVTGNAVVTGDITAYYSDERLKTFKGKITEPLAKIKQLNGYYFVENELAKSLGYDNDKLQVGVSAQEVEKVFPEIVTKAPIDNEYKTVWYQKLTPLLIEGMKEQQTQIEHQQTQIQSLQEQINELKALISK